MQEKVRGMVLRRVRYNDTSCVLDLFTDAEGRSAYIIKDTRAKKNFGALRGAVPLAVVDLEIVRKKGGKMAEVTEGAWAVPFGSVHQSPVKMAILLFLSEFLCYALRHEGKNEPLWAYLQHSMQWLDACEEGQVANFHLVFLMRLARFLGIYPNLEGYEEGAYFDLQGACFVRQRPLHPFFLEEKEAAVVRAVARMNYRTMHLFLFNRGQRVRCLEVLNEYYKLHVPDFPTLKSLDVLRELFD